MEAVPEVPQCRGTVAPPGSACGCREVLSGMRGSVVYGPEVTDHVILSGRELHPILVCGRICSCNRSSSSATDPQALGPLACLVTVDVRPPQPLRIHPHQRVAPHIRVPVGPVAYR